MHRRQDRKKKCKSTKLIGAVSIRVDDVDGQIVVRFRDFPPAILSALHAGLIRKELLFHFAAMHGCGDVFVSDHDAVFPARVFAGMQPWAVDGVRRHVSQLFFAIQSGDLIFFEELPEFVGVAPFYFVDSFDEVRFFRSGSRRGNGRLLGARGRCGGKRGEQRCCGEKR